MKKYSSFWVTKKYTERCFLFIA